MNFNPIESPQFSMNDNAGNNSNSKRTISFSSAANNTNQHQSFQTQQQQQQQQHQQQQQQQQQQSRSIQFSPMTSGNTTHMFGGLHSTPQSQSSSNVPFSTTGIGMNTPTTTTTSSSPMFGFQTHQSPSTNFGTTGIASSTAGTSTGTSFSSSSPLFNTNSSTNMTTGGGGLRRRTVGSSSSSSSILNNVTNSTVTSRPPLPSMTRLTTGVMASSSNGHFGSSNDLKENVNSLFSKKSETMSILKNGMSPMNQGGIKPLQPIINRTNMTQSPTESSTSTSALLSTTSTPTSTITAAAAGAANTGTVAATDYKCWVVLYGFTNAFEYNTIMTKFETYGIINDKFPSTLGCGAGSHTSHTASTSNGCSRDSNWVCIKYKSSLQADKALCQHGSLIHIRGDSLGSSGSSSSTSSSKHVIIGVMQMQDSIAKNLGLRNYLEYGSIGIGLVENESSKKNVRFAPSIMGEDDILLTGENNATTATNTTSTAATQQNGNGQVYMTWNAKNGGFCEQLLSWYFDW